ncbi:MAG TPA: hypothetical protein VFT04_14425 [Gemmatimonadales bacterium]|nr:hypothetical protein [Gemmatimonadales bacterium]
MLNAGDAGAHGRFDRQARGWSWQLYATTHRAQVAAALGLAGVIGLGLARALRR